MKKTILFCLLALAVFLPSCNEENTENDAAYSQMLPGTWMVQSTLSDKSVVTEIFQFKGDEFRYTYSITDENAVKSKDKIVSGAWNVKRSTLQLKYDLSTVECIGCKPEEARQFELDLKAWNANLEYQNKNGRVHGLAILEFTKVNGRTCMRLYGYNNLFEQISY